MPVPTNLSDLSTTAASNYPAATDTISTADDYIRALASIVARIGDGTNALVSPSVTTSLVTGSTTFALVNTTATTVNFAGAATTLAMGAGAAATATLNFTTGIALNTDAITTTKTTVTALAGATTLLTLGGTGATAVVAIPGTLEQSTTTGALTVAGGVYVAKKLTAAGLITGSAGVTVASGQTLTLTGATVAGQPTWSSAQTIPGIVLSGNITESGARAITITGALSAGAISGTTVAVGSGSTTSAGLEIGYYGSSGYGAIWSTAVGAHNTNNYAIASNGTDTYLNGATSSNLQAGNVNIAKASSTGLAVTGDISVSTKTPANASAAGVAGTITWDASYLYVATATNTWKRVGIATW